MSTRLDIRDIGKDPNSIITKLETSFQVKIDRKTQGLIREKIFKVSSASRMTSQFSGGPANRIGQLHSGSIFASSTASVSSSFLERRTKATGSSLISNQVLDSELIFSSSVTALKAELANAGTHLAIDSNVRSLYVAKIQEMTAGLRAKVATGRMTWLEAAMEAQKLRNTIMDLLRNKSTPVGKSLAQTIKSQGKTFNELVARKTQQLHGTNANFSLLAEKDKNRIYADIVKSAGKSNPQVTALMRKLSTAGKGLIVISIGLSIYAVYSSEDKPRAAMHEATVTASGVGGGIAGGLMAGLACGPGSPVCSAVGAFVGGALAAFGTSMLW